jgi:hypothetical protein
METPGQEFAQRPLEQLIWPVAEVDPVAVMEARHAEAREARAARAARRLEAEKQLHRQLRAGDLRCLGTPEGVSGAFPSLTQSILTEIYLCHACSGHESEPLMMP